MPASRFHGASAAVDRDEDCVVLLPGFEELPELEPEPVPELDPLLGGDVALFIEIEQNTISCRLRRRCEHILREHSNGSYLPERIGIVRRDRNKVNAVAHVRTCRLEGRRTPCKVTTDVRFLK